MSWADRYISAQADYFRYVGTAPSAETREWPGVFAVRTHVFSNSENGVVASDVDPGTSDELIRGLIAWFAEARVPSSWLRPGSGKSPRLVEDLIRAGFEPAHGASAMGATLRSLDPAMARARSVHIERVRARRKFEQWLDVAEASGWFQDDEHRRAYGALHLDLGFDEGGLLSHSVAFFDDIPIGMETSFFTGSTVLLRDVAVIPDARRLGVATALVRSRHKEALANGFQDAVLMPTPNGRQLFASMGFEPSPLRPDSLLYTPLAC